jgi:gliding motility-associated-like protein
LNGSASDPGGSIASLLWTQDSGPTSATLINPTTTTLTVDNLAIGTYVFRLSATDNEGTSASSTASVLVTDFNLPPVAVAPSDTTILLPDNVVQLTGSVSDPDGTVVDVAWTQVGGEPAELAGEIPTLSAVNLTPGVYTFRLTATDNLGVEAFDDFVVTVAMGSDPLGASKVFTPNGDAVNNFWIVKNLSLVQNCPVTIFNRLGNVVYSATDYQNDWDGTSLKGQPLQEGDYYFVFKCGGQESFTGALRIIR